MPSPVHSPLSSCGAPAVAPEDELLSKNLLDVAAQSPMQEPLPSDWGCVPTIPPSVPAAALRLPLAHLWDRSLLLLNFSMVIRHCGAPGWQDCIFIMNTWASNLSALLSWRTSDPRLFLPSCSLCPLWVTGYAETWPLQMPGSEFSSSLLYGS